MRTTWPLTKWKLQVKTVSRLQILKKNLQKIDFWNRVGAILQTFDFEAICNVEIYPEVLCQISTHFFQLKLFRWASKVSAS